MVTDDLFPVSVHPVYGHDPRYVAQTRPTAPESMMRLAGMARRDNMSGGG